jgi:RecA-family ATPase
MSATVTRSALHEAALEYAAKGWRIFPIRPDRKEPLGELVPRGFHDASCDPAVIDKWWEACPNANIAFSPHEVGLAVVDIDGGQEGVDNWMSLQDTHGEVPSTYAVETPRGGLHLYYRGEVPPSVGVLAPHIDTRGRGSYALLAPSVVGGKPYRPLNNLSPADLPAFVPAILAANKRERARAAADVELNRPVNVDRATLYLERAEPVIEGQQADKNTYVVACKVMEFGITPELAVELMLKHWAPRCTPCDERMPAFIERKVENAAAYAQNEAGAWAVAPAGETFDPAVLGKLLEESKPQPPAVGPVRFRDVLTRTVAPVWELVPSLIERGVVTFLSAPGGSHKSRLALQWGLCLGSGAAIFGRPVDRVTFVYLSYEDHADEVARRAQAISRRLGLADVDGHYLDLTQGDAPLAVVNEAGECREQPFGEALRGFLRSLPGHKFVVLDGTYNGVRFAGAAKINETSVMAGIDYLQRLCDETDSTMLPLWHPSQAGQERGDASGWSVAWHNRPRARLSISPVKDRDDAFELKVEKRNHGPKGKPVTLYFDGGALLPRTEIAEEDRDARLLDACVEVANTAAEQGNPIQKQHRLYKWMLDEIEAAAGYRPADREVKETLALAMRRGRLRYVDHTRHRAAGYYPADMNRAHELAREAMQRRKAQEAADA